MNDNVRHITDNERAYWNNKPSIEYVETEISKIRVGVGFPDYANVVSLVKDNNNQNITRTGTFSSDGWVTIALHGFGGLGRAYILINGKKISGNSSDRGDVFGNGTDRWDFDDHIIYPVKQGDTWSVQVTGQMFCRWMSFMPMRG